MGAIECERNKYYKVATETQRWVEESQEQLEYFLKLYLLLHPLFEYDHPLYQHPIISFNFIQPILFYLLPHLIHFFPPSSRQTAVK